MKGRPTLSKPGMGGGGADFAALGGRGTTAGPTNTQSECRTALHIRGTDPPCPPVVAGRYSEIPTAPPCSTAGTLGSQQRLPFVTTLRLWLTIFPRSVRTQAVAPPIRFQAVRTQAVRTQAARTQAVRTQAVRTQAVRTQAVRTQAVAPPIRFPRLQRP